MAKIGRVVSETVENIVGKKRKYRLPTPFPPITMLSQACFLKGGPSDHGTKILQKY